MDMRDNIINKFMMQQLFGHHFHCTISLLENKNNRNLEKHIFPQQGVSKGRKTL